VVHRVIYGCCCLQKLLAFSLTESDFLCVSRILTATDDWQNECGIQARAGKIFVVEGYSDVHREFFQTLKSAYGYDLECLDHYLICRPKPDKRSKTNHRASTIGRNGAHFEARGGQSNVRTE
jgi:hypothetical protein